MCVFVCLSCVYRWEGVKATGAGVAGKCKLFYVGVGPKLESS